MICPLGALFSLFNKVSLFRVAVTQTCNACGLCVQKCPMEIHPVQQRNSLECIRCLECNRIKHFRLGVE